MNKDSSQMKSPLPDSRTPVRQGDSGEKLRARAESVGSQLGSTLMRLLAEIPGAPLGPKMLSDRFDISIGTASRFLRAVAEQAPLDVLLDIPGPVPLRRFLVGAGRTGLPEELVRIAEQAVGNFELLIRQSGGNRRALTAVLANWQPKGRNQFILRRRQAVHQSMAELKGVSSQAYAGCFAFYPSSEDEAMLDAVKIDCSIGIARSNMDASVYFGSRRQAGNEAVPADPRRCLTIDGDPVADGIHSVRLDEFCPSHPAVIESTRIDDEIIHSLGRTELGPGSEVDLVLAEVSKPAARRRGRDWCQDPLSVFALHPTPTRKLVLDLLLHDECVPEGQAQLLVYSILARGPALVGDPSRFLDLENIPETLEIRRGGIGDLHVQEYPQYLRVLEHCFHKLGWDSRHFCSWRLQVDFPPPGAQFCILLG